MAIKHDRHVKIISDAHFYYSRKPYLARFRKNIYKLTLQLY